MLSKATLLLMIFKKNTLLLSFSVINPSGVSKEKQSPLIAFLKLFSPIKYAIEAILISEFHGLEFGVQGKAWRWLDLPKMGGMSRAMFFRCPIIGLTY